MRRERIVRIERQKNYTFWLDSYQFQNGYFLVRAYRVCYQKDMPKCNCARKFGLNDFKTSDVMRGNKKDSMFWVEHSLLAQWNRKTNRRNEMVELVSKECEFLKCHKEAVNGGVALREKQKIRAHDVRVVAQDVCPGNGDAFVVATVCTEESEVEDTATDNLRRELEVLLTSYEATVLEDMSFEHWK